MTTLTEEFFYDTLGRLDYSRRNGVQNLDLAYESDGSLAGRTEGGVSYQYVYGSSHPHAVETVLYNCSCSCLEDNYAYDANGNMTNRAGQSIAWTSADLPSQIGQGAYASAFSYTPSRGRWKQVASYNGTTETTTYLGGLVEKVQRGAVTEYRHYIPAGAGSMAIHTRRSGASPASSTYYVTGDHLGSATTVMDEAGASLANLSFAALGSRRRASWQDQLLAEEWAPITATTRRGFTGHEHLDNLSLIHMNGRVYDPKLGRFLSADPVWLGDLAAPQSLNPYSYVGNNPLSATDPSGYRPIEEASFFATSVDLIANGALLDVQNAVDNYTNSFSQWRSECLAALALCDGATVPRPTAVTATAKSAVRASVAVQSMIYNDLMTQEQIREAEQEAWYEQASARMKAAREAKNAGGDFIGFAEVGGRMVPVIGVTEMNFGGGALMTSLNPDIANGWRGQPLMADNDITVEAGRHAGIAATLEIAGGVIIGASMFIPPGPNFVVGATGVAILSAGAFYHYYYARSSFENSLNTHIGEIEKNWNGP